MSFSFSKDVVDWWSEQVLKLAPYWELFMGWMTEKQEEELTYKLKEILRVAIESRKDCVPTTPPSEIDKAFSCGTYVIGLRGGFLNPLTFINNSSRYVNSLMDLGWFGVGIVSRGNIGAVVVFFSDRAPTVRQVMLLSLMLGKIEKDTFRLLLFINRGTYKVVPLFIIPYKKLDVSSAESAELVNALATNEETRKLLESYINKAIDVFKWLSKYLSVYLLY
ncbi:MAG: hypothetical protein L7H04_05615 [Vulcanisaeta sp.]|nr:hypothetical protein [Vulcanisaeta sp.]